MILLDRHGNGHAGVIGFGKTGRSAVEALEQSGFRVSLFDDFGVDDTRYRNLVPEEFDWKTLDFLLVSPGISLLWPRPHPAVKLALEHSVPVINDVDLFRRQVTGRIMGVTGTNGKSTTCALIQRIMKADGEKIAVGGNFGTPVLSMEADEDFYVLELSSYQLESCNILGFDVAVLLNITPDHLTRHGGMAGYVTAKRKIFADFTETSTAIVGVDDEYSRKTAEFLRSIKHPNVVPISGKIVPEGGVGWERDHLSDNRCGDSIVICAANSTYDGVHNRQNIAAAYAACAANGVAVEKFVAALLSFGGLEHRQEVVAELDGVLYVNDSKATNAESVEFALRRFEDIFWILGGRPKENGIRSLGKYFHRIRHAFLIGEAADEWSRFLTENGVANEVCCTLEVALERAHRTCRICCAKVVLLSPACASFDQFRDFEHRGNEFKRLVRRLQSGEITGMYRNGEP
ncbi:MAG: UDP-N-acetylmuramoyl-L-alanine--D-glutamate ligase [Holosporaceae bacterium]|jgi:UDP-N-acetylmuramoylalanine--D-glutamate ligase|nr:UDP-N-acetylmuramoyl-L-alanine--D-glutamate ligase [Holosporaceae bacterium]